FYALRLMISWIASTIFGVHYPLRNFRICQTVLRRRLQKERIRKRIYKTRDLARADIFDYIEVFYNRARRHSHLGGVSPEAFEQASS
ncbi:MULTISPECIES: IS3 family transposase, partial [Klebsiella pneumoniae complex]